MYSLSWHSFVIGHESYCQFCCYKACRKLYWLLRDSGKEPGALRTMTCISSVLLWVRASSFCHAYLLSWDCWRADGPPGFLFLDLDGRKWYPPLEIGGRGQGGEVGATCKVTCLTGTGETCSFCFLIAFLPHRDFKDLDLEMVASRCLLELGLFPLGYLPQHLT